MEGLRGTGVFSPLMGKPSTHIDLVGEGSKKYLMNAQNVEYLSTKWCVVDNSKRGPKQRNVKGLGSMFFLQIAARCYIPVVLASTLVGQQTYLMHLIATTNSMIKVQIAVTLVG
ncbi:hypothetical protein Ancab_011727 [Ancistrocladus abbreviatus]